MKSVLQWEIPKWFTRIISIILLWYMIPFCTGIVEGFIRNDVNGYALLVGVILFPFLGILNFITTIAAFCHFLGFQNSTLGSLTAILLLIAAVPLYIGAVVLSVLYCIKPCNWYWIVTSIVLLLASIGLKNYIVMICGV